MSISLKSAALGGASLLLLGASLGTAEAFPAAPPQAGVHAAGVDQVAYRNPGSRGLRSNSRCARKPSRC